MQGTLLYAVPGRTERRPAAGARVSLLGSGVEVVALESGRFLLAGVRSSEGQLLIQFDQDADGTFERQRVLELGDLGAGLGREVELGEVLRRPQTQDREEEVGEVPEEVLPDLARGGDLLEASALPPPLPSELSSELQPALPPVLPPVHFRPPQAFACSRPFRLLIFLTSFRKWLQIQVKIVEKKAKTKAEYILV